MRKIREIGLESRDRLFHMVLNVNTEREKENIARVS